MSTAFLLLALGTGILGSLHCVGMCGPIALALPLKDEKPALAILLYNIGRAITYAILGLLPGLLGLSLHLAGLSRWISIGLGVLLLVFVVLGFGTSLEKWVSRFGFYRGFKQKLGALFSKSGYKNLFSIGLLNGLLPCGLVYTALLLSVGAGSPFQAALFMFLFGLGTLPALFLLSYFGKYLQLSFRNALQKAVPFVLVLVALLLILRGLNLGIPLLSPKVETQTGKMECCDRQGD